MPIINVSPNLYFVTDRVGMQTIYILIFLGVGFYIYIFFLQRILEYKILGIIIAAAWLFLPHVIEYFYTVTIYYMYCLYIPKRVWFRYNGKFLSICICFWSFSQSLSFDLITSRYRIWQYFLLGRMNTPYFEINRKLWNVTHGKKPCEKA